MSLTPSTPLSKQPKPNRDSNIELLRILSMLGVVILHYNNASMGGGFALVPPNSLNETILYALEGLFICAVNLFILISGYFSCTSRRVDPAKAFSLLLQVIVFGGIEYGASLLSGEAFSVQSLFKALLPANYFVWLYIATYLLSPYINLMLSKLTHRQRNQLLLLCVVFFSVWPALLDLLQSLYPVDLTSLSTISLFGNQQGYTITNFLLMYLIGAWLRLSGFTVKKRYSLLVLILCTVATTWLSRKHAGIAWSYHNPIVIISAVAAFCLFRQFSIRSKVINCLAKGAFSCFLLHMVFLPKYHIEKAVSGTPLQLLGHILFCAVSVYLMCFVVHVVYSLLTKPLISLVSKLFQKIHFCIEVNEEQSV